MDPIADIDMVSVVVFQDLRPDEVEIDLRDDTLQQLDMTLFVNNEEFVAGGARQNDCSIRLSELDLFGTDIDIEQYFDPGFGNGQQTATWLFLLSTGTDPMSQTRAAVFLVPTTTETQDYLTMTNDDTVLAYDADLLSLIPATMPPGVAPKARWSSVTTGADGQPYTVGRANQLTIARFADQTPTDLEHRAHELDLCANELWTMELGPSTQAELSDLTGEQGGFRGIDEEDTWLMWMWCSSCMNSLPQFLTVLEAGN